MALPALLAEIMNASRPLAARLPAASSGPGLAAFRRDEGYEKANPTPATATTPGAMQFGDQELSVLQSTLADIRRESEDAFKALRAIPGVRPESLAALQESYKPKPAPKFADRNDLLALLPLLFAPDRIGAATYAGGVASGMQNRYGERQASQAQAQAMAQQAAAQQVANEERESARRRGDIQMQLGGLESTTKSLLDSYELKQRAANSARDDKLAQAQLAETQQRTRFNEDFKTRSAIDAANQGLGNVGFSRGNVPDLSYDSVMQRAKSYNQTLRGLQSPDAMDDASLKSYVDAIYVDNTKNVFFNEYSKAANARAKKAAMQAAMDRLKENKGLPKEVRDSLIKYGQDALDRDVFTTDRERATAALDAVKKKLLDRFGVERERAEIDKLVEQTKYIKGQEAAQKDALKKLNDKVGAKGGSLVSLLGTLQRASSDLYATPEERMAASEKLSQAMPMVDALLGQIGRDLGYQQPSPNAPPGPLMGGLQGYNQGGQVININVPPGGYTSTGGAAFPGGAPPAPQSGGLLNGGLNISPALLDRVITNPSTRQPVSLRQVQQAFTNLVRSKGVNHPQSKQAFRNLQYVLSKVQQPND